MMYLLVFTSFMILFLTQLLNFSEQKYGMILVIFEVGMFFWQLIILSVLDIVGRKTVMIPGSFIAIFLLLITANFHSNFWNRHYQL